MFVVVVSVVVCVVADGVTVWVSVTVVDEVGAVTDCVRVVVVPVSVLVVVTVVVCVGVPAVVVVELDLAEAVFAGSVVVDVDVVGDASVVVPVVGAVRDSLLVCVTLALRLEAMLCPPPEPHAATAIAHRTASVV